MTKKPWRLTLIIKVTQDVVPHAIYTKTVALPMRPRVQEELDRMEFINIIT